MTVEMFKKNNQIKLLLLLLLINLFGFPLISMKIWLYHVKYYYVSQNKKKVFLKKQHFLHLLDRVKVKCSLSELT